MTAILELLLGAGVLIGGLGLLLLGIHEARGGDVGWASRRALRRADHDRELRRIAGRS